MANGYKIKSFFLRNAYFSKPQFFLWILLALFGMILPVRGLTADQKVGYDAHGRRDPFVPLVTLASKAAAGLTAVESAEDLTIEGVVYDPKRGSIVVVNGSVMKEGEELGNVKVLEIKSNGAWFLVSGTRAFKSIHQNDAQNERTP